MAKATFDGIQKIITIKDNVTAIDIGIDVYSEWKRWAMLELNGRFLSAFRSIGGDQITESSKLGASYFLENGWKIRPYEGDHTLRVNGNIYCDDSSSPFIHTIGNYNVQVISTVSAIIETEIVEINTNGSSNDLIKLFVYFDMTSSYSGTTYPIGSFDFPSNNILDAINIAKNNGIDTIKILHNTTISNIRFDHINLIGTSGVSVTLENVTTNGTISFMNVSGSLNDHCILNQCKINQLIVDTAELKSCIFSDMLTITGNSVILNNCYSSPATTLKINTIEQLDMNLLINNYNGNIELQNIINNHNACIHFVSGGLIIDSTCSGNIDVTGLCSLLNNSTSNVIYDRITSPENIVNKLMSYDMNHIENDDRNSFGGFIKNKLLTTLKFLGLK